MGAEAAAVGVAGDGELPVGGAVARAADPGLSPEDVAEVSGGESPVVKAAALAAGSGSAAAVDVWFGEELHPAARAARTTTRGRVDERVLNPMIEIIDRQSAESLIPGIPSALRMIPSCCHPVRPAVTPWLLYRPVEW